VDVRQIASFVKSGVGGADLIVYLAATGTSMFWAPAVGARGFQDGA
jgi:hypothetical protein